MSPSPNPKQNSSGKPPLDNLSDGALHFMAHAKKHGMSWIHPCLLESPGPVRELVDAGVLVVRPQLVHPVLWPWEEL